MVVEFSEKMSFWGYKFGRDQLIFVKTLKLDKISKIRRWYSCSAGSRSEPPGFATTLEEGGVNKADRESTANQMGKKPRGLDIETWEGRKCSKVWVTNFVAECIHTQSPGEWEKRNIHGTGLDEGMVILIISISEESQGRGPKNNGNCRGKSSQSNRACVCIHIHASQRLAACRWDDSSKDGINRDSGQQSWEALLLIGKGLAFARSRGTSLVRQYLSCLLPKVFFP